MGTSIDTIGFDAHCQWFKINYGSTYLEYIFHNNILDTHYINKSVTLIDDLNLFTLISCTPERYWNETIKIINDWYRTFNNFYFEYHNRNVFNSISGLKPIFIAYKLK